MADRDKQFDDGYMTNEELVSLCREIIKKHSSRTEQDYYEVTAKVQILYPVMANIFQKACLKAMYDKLWLPESKTIVCLFDDLI